jgi:hypothetical protein
MPAGEHTPPGWGRWLLVRRQILTPDSLCAGPPGTSDDELIRVAGTRTLTASRTILIYVDLVGSDGANGMCAQQKFRRSSISALTMQG